MNSVIKINRQLTCIFYKCLAVTNLLQVGSVSGGQDVTNVIQSRADNYRTFTYVKTEKWKRILGQHRSTGEIVPSKRL